jgi:type IV secretory pathway component VirB8
MKIIYAGIKYGDSMQVTNAWPLKYLKGIPYLCWFELQNKNFAVVKLRSDKISEHNSLKNQDAFEYRDVISPENYSLEILPKETEFDI